MIVNFLLTIIIIVNLIENVDLFKGSKTDMRSPCKTSFPLTSMPNSSLSNSDKKNTKNTLLSSQSTIQGLKSIISTRNSNDDSNMSYKNNIKITEAEQNAFVREKSLKVFPSKMLRRNPESKIVISSINKNNKISVLKLDEIALKVKIRRLISIE